MPGGRGDAAVVVGRCVRGVLRVVAQHAPLRTPEWRCGGCDEWLRVVVGSQPRRRGAAGCAPDAGSFVVGRLALGVLLGTGWCGSGRVVACRPYQRNTHTTLETGCVWQRVRGVSGTQETGCVDPGTIALWRTLETGCVWSRVRGVGERVKLVSGSEGVGA